MPTPTEVLALAQDEAFLSRVTLAFATAAYGILAPPNPAPADPVRLKQLQAARLVSEPGKTRELARQSLTFVLGAPAVIAAGAAVSDQDLATIVTTIVTATTEYAALGGTLE